MIRPSRHCYAWLAPCSMGVTYYYGTSRLVNTAHACDTVCIIFKSTPRDRATPRTATHTHTIGHKRKSGSEELSSVCACGGV